MSHLNVSKNPQPGPGLADGMRSGQFVPPTPSTTEVPLGMHGATSVGWDPISAGTGAPAGVGTPNGAAYTDGAWAAQDQQGEQVKARKSGTWKKVAAVVVIFFVGFGIGKVGGSGDAPAQTPAPAPAAQQAPAPAAAPAPDQSGALKFGQSHVYENGVEMTVSAPAKYKPGKYFAGGEGAAQFAKVTVSIKNGSTQAFEPTMALLTASSAGQESHQIFDGKVGGSPSTSVLPGKTVKWDVAFGVQSLDDLTIEGSPAFDYANTVWTN